MHQYNGTTTTDEVLEGVDLAGLRVVITGAAGGLGCESARAFAAHGATVTVLARSRARVADAVAQIERFVPAARVEAGAVDLADLSAIRRFADGYLATHDTIDVLMNNAGIMACPFGRTVDGFETQFGTNHLGHFLLTTLLSPALLASSTPRVVTLSSGGHARSDVDLDDPNFEHTEYSPWIAYGRSKTANALFARELGRRAGQRGLLSFSVHPGAVHTGLGRHLTDALVKEVGGLARERATVTTNQSDEARGRISWKSVEAGAATQVWAATAPDIADHNGAYLADCGLGVLGASPGVNGFLPYLLDDDHAARLWDLSEELVGSGFAP